MPDLVSLYRFRFREGDRHQKMAIWRTLCDHFFQRLIGENQIIADLACGYGEFINNIRGKKKYAIDLNPDARQYLNPDIEFLLLPADGLDGIADGAIDIVFTSNFLEHLRTKEECDAVLAEVRRILRPGGRFVIMGPNIRYLTAEYWDFYDHNLPLSHLSLEEGLVQAGYDVTSVIPRFLPYSTRSRLPKSSMLIALYLKVPLVWHVMGKQFLLVGQKPAAAG